MGWELNGEDLHEIGASDVALSFRNQDADTLSFIVAKGALEDGVPLGAGDEVELTHGSDVVFSGVVTSVPAVAEHNNEAYRIECSGGWWFLDNLVFQQQWKATIGGELQTFFKSRVLLGQNAAGGKISAGAIITEVISYAASCGCPVSVGSISLPQELPVLELLDVTCGEAIRAVLRWFPDAYLWFDHSEGRFNLARAGSLTAATVAISSERLVKFDATERADLAVPEVVIYYDYEDETPDGIGAWSARDSYPEDSTGQMLGALVATVELAGGSSTTVSQRLKVRAIDTSDPAWWRGKLPWLNEVSDLLIESPTSPEFTKEIIDGDVPDWVGGGPESTKKEEVVRAIASYTTQIEGEPALEVSKKEISVRLTTTSLNGGTYTRMASAEEREPIPAGVAQSIYEAANQAYYQGSAILEDEEAVTNYLGKRFRVTGGPGAYASMIAPIYSCDIDVDTGRTTISFGPPAHLGLQDLIERLRANRRRRATTWWTSRPTGKTKSPKIPVGGGNGGSAPASGGGSYKSIVLHKAGMKIVLDPSDLECGTEARLRKVTVFGGEDGFQTLMVLASDQPCPETESPFEEVDVQLCADGEIITRKLLARKQEEGV